MLFILEMFFLKTKKTWDQDEWIAYFSKRKEFIEKTIKEAQAVLAGWKAVNAEWKAVYAGWEAREKYYKRKVEMLQGLVSTSLAKFWDLSWRPSKIDMSVLGTRNHRSQ